MIKKCVLVIDKRIELSTKYKKLLEQLNIFAPVTHELNDAIKILAQYEPDLVIVSDSLDGKLSENCRKIKMLTSNTRPCIVAISKSEHLQDKLDVLEMGADDFFSDHDSIGICIVSMPFPERLQKGGYFFFSSFLASFFASAFLSSFLASAFLSAPPNEPSNPNAPVP